LGLKTAGDYGCILSRKGEEECQIQLVNAIGNPLDSKLINIDPDHVEMSATHIIVASYDHVYAWQYRN
jgi:WD repeat-containing protein 35